jgi:hypothetical protein
MDGIEALAELMATVTAAAGRLAVVIDQVEAMAARVEQAFAMVDKIGRVMDIGMDVERERLGIPVPRPWTKRNSRLRPVR